MKRLLFSVLTLALLAVAGGTRAAPPAAHPAAPVHARSFDEDFQAARALATSGQREEAIRAYTNLLKRSTRNADVLLGRGQVYSWMKRWPEAEGDLTLATRTSPRYAGAWSALGDMYLWSNRPALAAEAYGRWVELSPKDPAPWMARGRAWRAAGDNTAARADFDAARALGADPKQVEGYIVSLERRATPDAAAPLGYKWAARLDGTFTEFSPDRANWTDHVVSVRHYFERWSLAAELLQANHFRTRDRGWALDAYVNLWSRAYANLRYQPSFTKGGVLPDLAWRAELFQGVGSGWELSASYDQLDFGSITNLYGLGAGKYIGPFYLRARHLFTHSSTSNGNSDSLLGRWYYARNGDDYLELRGGYGESTQDVFGTPGATTNGRNSSVSLAVVRYFAPHWGAKFGVSYGDEYGGFVSRGIGATLYTRW